MTRPKKGFYLFFSDDRKTLVLLAEAQVPISVSEFIESVRAWVKNAEANQDTLEEIIESEGTDGNGEFH